MKCLRTIASFLILVMASSPVLAAVCSISCATGLLAANITTSVDFIASDSSTMTADHCHHGVATANQHTPGKQTPDQQAYDKHPSNAEHQSNTEHKGCTMAGGCHFAQAALSSKILLLSVNYTSVTLPHFTPSTLAADLPPPIKPPA